MDSDDDPRRKARIDGSRQWEVLFREDSTEPMRHVGSVTAPSGDLAVEQARTLFGDDEGAIWLCPADEMLRLGGNDLQAKGNTSSTAAESEVSPE
ncbi:rSAM-partnered protein [Haloferax mediterranei ATCC 33500]|uniref:RSAM-partnered protein n=1 Tax=Haloferax mediterranei (strain ATCC 33500 / DSM 1411 / JCM 8866 / NBRC 14739 / NCIMB 2177 / R-4) TaxID=523841 RepID=I3R3N4_HALMT|nr:Htur_1727 family rSAM-partnered candidate RiPP [Haloferax mediterranei]AFK18844.1 hypothetical protein HFX_1128 [Haloferax mediterranei ATCC 33500]AHZ21791.1 hypothetical protein BM92_03570 [Haloferax mediterranei ATCC 33500]EMA03298.1 hypothetical protein C439_04850 [Haloferax mediterranei ATCC 33500]MDX5988937.1 Htur_1727 family rSAM-partnered candidate RiPP [Haloferax mediterranei ATCC 33500]QCQ75332.1 rSAM-partnered protein [Haloferax mediterranei ATCC 33500]